jgi:hypothetical protein
MPGDANLPVPTSKLDRSAMERVLARAAELQAGSGEPEEALSEEQILELGKEVGLSPQHLRQALAEERTRVSVPGSDSTASMATCSGPNMLCCSSWAG